MQDLETKLKEWLASAPSSIRHIEVISFYHPSITPTTFHICREPTPLTLKDENNVTIVTKPAFFETKLAGATGTLDQKYEINLNVIEEESLFLEQWDKIALDTDTPISLTYREYLSNDLNTVQSIIKLEVETIAYSLGNVTFSAVTPRLNMTRTGEIYSARNFPMLRIMQ